MRPKILTISAFGPYAEEVTIDFDSLGQDGLYLISGNTGSGKSTIFEAIRFALYGDDGVDIKSADMFRSKYASGDIPTFVELEFTLRSENYKIKRNPKYMRPKTRGEGYTENKADALMVFPDGRLITGYSAVTSEITGLLGLNGDQFARIVMIAQGKFRELLLADTANRSKIFREIFKTSFYDQIQKNIKNKYLQYRSTYTKINDSLLQYVQGIKVNEQSEYFEELSFIKSKDIVTDIYRVEDILEELIKIDESESEQTVKRKEDVKEEIANISEKVLCLKNVAEYTKKLQCEERKLNELIAEEKEILEIYSREQMLQPQREKVATEIDNEKKSLEKYDICDEKRKELKSVSKKENDTKQKIAEIALKKKNLSETISENENYVKKTNGLEIKLSEIVLKKRDIEEAIKKVDTANKYLISFESACKEYDKSILEYRQSEQIAFKKNESYNNALKSFLDAQAGIMAEELANNPGTPCPVCGNIHYKALAKKTEDSPSEEDVKELKYEADIASKIALDKSVVAGANNKVKEREHELFINTVHEIGSLYDIEDAKEFIDEKNKLLQEEKSALKIQEKTVREENDKRTNIVLQIESDRKKLEDINESLKKCEEELKECQIKLKQYETELASLESELTCKSKEEAVLRLEKKKSIYNEMKRMLDQATTKRDSHNEKKASALAVINELTKQLKDKEMMLRETYHIEIGEYDEEKIQNIITDEENKMVELSLTEAQLNSQYNELYSVLAANREIWENVIRQHDEIEKKASVLAELKVLSDTLNGELEGKDKVKLETFVQISYFEQVIRRANVKLFEMTEGQYEFVRDKSGDDKRSKSGLELNVYDHYNGTIRSVKTLSGGESFMASLSLALGMADIIEESASGIVIDTMFIDEGFGSLDEASLEQAMKVLSKLSDGNKLVGIISHVGSLKDRIDKQINVTKNMAGGSTLKVLSQ